tara:strand:+ start:521 stop:1183 length:663 start_codon:yes stop_codon:yes gene_type:complete
MINKIYNFIIYILRYLSIVKFSKYKVSDNINFGSKIANNFFIKSIKNSKSYFEYGSGNSTMYAKKLKKNFLSIETDKSFYNFMKKKNIKNIIYCNIGPTKYYSYPILPIFLIKPLVENYGNKIEIFFKKTKKIPDLILIDGRFRVFVTLAVIKFCSLNNKKLNTVIIIDDFKDRKSYHILKNILKIKSVGRLGIINLNEKTKLNKNKINQYLNKFVLSYI